MRQWVIAGLLLSALLLSVACAAPQSAAPVAEAPAPAAEAPVEGGQSVAGLQPTGDRMIVRTVDMRLVVTDAQATMQTIEGLVGDAGGYITESNAWREGEQLRARMTLRIPASGLEQALVALRGLAVRVERENTTGQDVTEEYSDLDARLVNLQATERELRELLTEVRERTGEAEEILQVHRELSSIRGEIEQVKGRMQYLDNLTALATIRVELIPDVLAMPVVGPGWRPQETLKNAGRQLTNTLRGLADAAIWLVVYVLPVLVIVLIPFVAAFLFIRWLVRRGRRPVLPQKPQPGDAGG